MHPPRFPRAVAYAAGPGSAAHRVLSPAGRQPDEAPAFDLASLVSFADCLDELDIPASAGGRNRWT